MMRTKLYIAGPMTGIPEYNFPAFAEAEFELTQAGYQVLSPHRVALPCGCVSNDGTCGVKKHEWQDYLRADLIAMLEFNPHGIALLPGWQDSKGAMVEARLAQGFGWTLWSVNEWLRKVWE